MWSWADSSSLTELSTRTLDMDQRRRSKADRSLESRKSASARDNTNICRAPSPITQSGRGCQWQIQSWAKASGPREAGLTTNQSDLSQRNLSHVIGLTESGRTRLEGVNLTPLTWNMKNENDQRSVMEQQWKCVSVFEQLDWSQANYSAALLYERKAGVVAFYQSIQLIRCTHCPSLSGREEARQAASSAHTPWPTASHPLTLVRGNRVNREWGRVNRGSSVSVPSASNWGSTD